LKNWSKILKRAGFILLLGTIFLLFAPFFFVTHGREPSSSTTARVEMSAIVQAIEAYNNAYGHMPVSPTVQRGTNSGDFTFGSIIGAPTSPMPLGTMVGGKVVANAEVIAILMDLTNYPGNPGRPTINANHCLNPQQTIFLNPRMVSDNISPGVGPDLVYRDPWGMPYFITLDLNGDERCKDAFYSKRVISQINGSGASGYNGLSNSVDAGGNGNHFQYQGRVMVWSAGSDRKINVNLPANQGENRDNVVSWQ
jgi:hypothetical protein